jgi:hypothetical protein
VSTNFQNVSFIATCKHDHVIVASVAGPDSQIGAKVALNLFFHYQCHEEAIPQFVTIEKANLQDSIITWPNGSFK